VGVKNRQVQAQDKQINNQSVAESVGKGKIEENQWGSRRRRREEDEGGGVKTGDGHR